eukprot:2787859-Amphidinium_carterae.1
MSQDARTCTISACLIFLLFLNGPFASLLKLRRSRWSKLSAMVQIESTTSWRLCQEYREAKLEPSQGSDANKLLTAARAHSVENVYGTRARSQVAGNIWDFRSSQLQYYLYQ